MTEDQWLQLPDYETKPSWLGHHECVVAADKNALVAAAFVAGNSDKIDELERMSGSFQEQSNPVPSVVLGAGEEDAASLPL